MKQLHVYARKQCGNRERKADQTRTQSGRQVVNHVAHLSVICEQNSGTAVSFGPFPSSQTYRAIQPNKDGHQHGWTHVGKAISHLLRRILSHGDSFSRAPEYETGSYYILDYFSGSFTFLRAHTQAQGKLLIQHKPNNFGISKGTQMKDSWCAFLTATTIF